MLSRMNFYALLVIGLCLVFLNIGHGQATQRVYSETYRQKVNINQGWQFYLEEEQGIGKDLKKAGASWEEVAIPHTLALAPLDLSDMGEPPHQPTFHRYVGWYQRELVVEAKEGQKVFLEFEGVHQVTNLWVNDHYVGEHAIGGYTPFHFDITPFVKENGQKNQILLSADNRLNSNVPPDGHLFDFVKFGGLYRDVYLVVTDALHVTFPWEARDAGIFITTPTVSQHNATIDVKTSVRNDSDESQDCQVLTRIINENGIVVASGKVSRKLSPGSDHQFSQVMGITEGLRLWSIEQPYLYRVHTTVYKNEIPVDQVENPLGIRKFEFIRDRGFVLNGKPVELVGVNRHQAYPLIGDAVPNSLHWKDAWQFKQAGFNVVRLAHYPHDNAFIEACDELGILVYEEPPSWIGIGGDQWFDNLEESTRRMIRNHRNHPSILMWGGSINHRGPVPRLHYACKEEDPTRMTASNGSPWSGPRHSGVCDIYSPMDYQNMPLNPDEFVFLCEHGSSADASRNQFELSKARASANHLGVAVWTAHDYQSFKPNRGMYPRRPLSLYRVPNSVYYWYQSELLAEPIVHIADSRVAKAGKLLVFSNCEEVALYEDDALIETRRPDRPSDRIYIDHPSFTFNYDWTKSTITARGMNNGVVVGEHTLSKEGEPYRLKVVIETDGQPFYANGSDMKLARAYILDEEGHLVANDTTSVLFSVDGGEVIGDKELGGNPNTAHNGVASILIRSKESPGKLSVSAVANGLVSAETAIHTVAYESNRMEANTQPIYNIKKAMVDIGGSEERLLQFGWQEWTKEDKEALPLAAFENVTCRLASRGAPLEWLDGWGLSGDLAYVGADGIKVSPGSELSLVIEGLTAGQYRVTTYHHLMKEVEDAADSLEVIAKDAKGPRIVVDGFKPSMGNRLGNTAPHKEEYLVYAHGREQVVISILDKKGLLPIVLNGFEIREVVQSR